tara:strand:- start:3123 stop:3959 length:837 start_codon:yes stop_codon:yes gene_type:complete
MKKVSKNVWSYWTNNWADNYGKTEIDWKTTVGIGDSMYGLNIAHMRAFVNQKPTTLNLHYFHSKDFSYHYEDPETVFERNQYVMDRYMWKDIVHINHIFDSQDTLLWKERYRNVTRIKDSDMYRYWSFDPTYYTDSKYNKIVIWTPVQNNEQQIKSFKLPMLDKEWQRLIFLLKEFGYEIVELTYRTPISEVFYHIKTCEVILSYEGMWHYIAKNLFKPHIVFSNSNITKWHTPAAIQINSNKFFIDSDLKKIDYYIEAATEKAYNYKRMFNLFIHGW